MSKSKTRPVPVELLILSEKLQCRANVPQEVIEEYADAWKNGATFPPVQCYSIKGIFYVVDGFCRVRSAILASRQSVLCDITEGEWEDAVKEACGANASHGIRRSNADKAKAARVAIETWPKLSDRKISDLSKLSHTFVANVRKQLLDEAAFFEFEEKVQDDPKQEVAETSANVCPDCKSELVAVLTDGGNACKNCLCPIDDGIDVQVIEDESEEESVDDSEEAESEQDSEVVEPKDAQSLTKIKTAFGRLIRSIEDASLESLFKKELEAIAKKLKAIK
jgi:hypothetical protein